MGPPFLQNHAYSCLIVQEFALFMELNGRLWAAVES